MRGGTACIQALNKNVNAGIYLLGLGVSVVWSPDPQVTKFIAAISDVNEDPASPHNIDFPIKPAAASISPSPHTPPHSFPACFRRR